MTDALTVESNLAAARERYIAAVEGYSGALERCSLREAQGQPITALAEARIEQFRQTVELQEAHRAYLKATNDRNDFYRTVAP
jgi:hypothetical protein